MDEILDVLRDISDSDEFILKSRVTALESAIAQRTGATHAIACASGTGALTLVLSALSIGPGDEVITPAFSFISSASTIALTGAKPVFVDVEPETATLDPAGVEPAITDATRAVLPAHLFSCTAPMSVLRAIADRHGLSLIEDSAVSLGAEVDGRPAGRHGDAGVYSFFPGKPLGGIGDGGMVITDHETLATACRQLRNHGMDLKVRFLHHKVGFNCRMDELVAGYLLRQLPTLDNVLEERRTLAQHYEERLRPLAPDLLPPPPDFTGRAVYTYVVRAKERARLRDHLGKVGITTEVYYPHPLHLQRVFRDLGYQRGDFPVAEQLAEESLALPLYQGLPLADVERVTDAVTEFYGRRP
ncbi:DegT/DnrJ/EryC1/StrS family aminotransferase [Longimycelium tulufanense]|uniref:DegT/DnrJ/EryC1/StrS family aminotransferase n=1 Tax=Longimycelium tulufanense TaxID=907463 RepID=UPI00166564DA|nr:DegT/DnrJ/EryC1/StrS family aminotransferase [Longimycelium tulufanense]